MAVRGRQMVPSTASRVLIKIEDHGAMSGLLYNPYLDVSRRFVDVVELADRLDGMFDSLSFPQATMEYRSFDAAKKKKRAKSAPAQAETPDRKVETEPMDKREKLNPQDSDTFVVHVQFRQNATWQGTIKWAGQNEEKRFRSTLELLKIMDSAITANHPEDSE
ncbi:hypothetical protein LJC64_01940 [Ruminococcaceae bacterium OttesenSCG-928-A11]|nr:hypothetical protein [Ruminococcaceae bacterium OttesenSCG-928-A11]